jgi:hypothetical protein
MRRLIRRRCKIVVQHRRQQKVADATEEADERQQIRRKPNRTKLDDPVPKKNRKLKIEKFLKIKVES